MLRVATDEPVGPVRASRFFMLRREDGTAPLIPRPYSIYRQGDDWIEFLVKRMGRGSRSLAAAAPGTELRLIGPLGNGWPTLDGDGPPWVLLAGGVGSAPIPMAVEQALAGMDGARPCPPSKLFVLFGARDGGLLYDLDALRELGVPVHAATLDGSVGFRGNVLELLDDLVSRGEVPAQHRLLACGPDPMLEAVHARALERGVDAWLSLETLMGCGVGICNGCPVVTRAEGSLAAWSNAKCCVEGPVFAARDIVLAHAH
ncbi:MAG: hypothetical protein R3F34_03620 [Planctomycetota bacterium]